MKRSALIRCFVIASVVTLVAASAYAPAIEHTFFYYSDAAMTTEVGQEGIPTNCPDDVYWSEGNIEAPYRKAVFYAECGWQTAMLGGYCQQYNNGWQPMTCP
jgi:hypothetical protein